MLVFFALDQAPVQTKDQSFLRFKMVLKHDGKSMLFVDIPDNGIVNLYAWQHESSVIAPEIYVSRVAS